MTKNFQLVGIVLMLAITFVSCKREYVQGEGAITKEARATTSFDKVKINLPVDATITVGEASENGLDITAYKNLHKHILTEVVDNTLRIYTNSHLRFDKDIEVAISTAMLTRLEITGSADAAIKGNVESENFELRVTGSAEVDIQELNTDGFTAKLSGASEVRVGKGSSKHATYKVTGSGDIDATGFETQVAQAKVSGAGEMNLNVSEKLDAHITGAGKIDYKGHPKISSHITGAGSLNDVN